MKKYKLFIVWIIIGAAIAIAGILYLQSNKENKQYNIIFIPKIIDENNHFWTQLIEGVEMAAWEKKADVSIVAPDAEHDIARQNVLIDWAIEQKPDAILLSPSSYTETTEYARKVKEAGIPLVLIDSEIDEDIADAVVATDNVKLGEVEGSFMKTFVTEDSKIAIMGHVKNSSTAIEREAGVRKGLGEDEERIVDVVFCNSEYDKAYNLMIELMEQYPDISIVAGLNEYSAVGAVRAIQDMKLDNRIKVVGIDSSLEEIQLLEAGVFEGIIVQNPYKMGYLGMEAAIDLLNGEKISKKIDSGCELITKDNLYTEENQKLLFPFKEE